MEELKKQPIFESDSVNVWRMPNGKITWDFSLEENAIGEMAVKMSELTQQNAALKEDNRKLDNWLSEAAKHCGGTEFSRGYKSAISAIRCYIGQPQKEKSGE